MRSRSCSVYTKRPEIVMNDACQETPLLDSFESELPPISLKKTYSAEDITLFFEDFGPMIQDTCKDRFSGDLGKPCCISTEVSTSTGSISLLTSRGSYSGAEFDEILNDTEDEKIQKICRAMVIGSRNSGKRSLLRSLFKEKNSTFSNIKKQPFDLVTKKVEKPDSTERYHFWLKEGMKNNGMIEPLLNVYYKSCSVFFLVYDVDDRASFEELKDELERVRQANPEDKELFLVLVGNKKGDKLANAVNKCEVCCLKKKYGIKVSLEVNVTKGVPDDLRTFLECYLKQN